LNIRAIEYVVNAFIVIVYVFTTLYVAWNASPITYLIITIAVVSIILFIQGLFKRIRELKGLVS